MVSKWTYSARQYPHMDIQGLQNLMKELDFSEYDKEQIMSGVAPDWSTLSKQSKSAFIGWIDY